MVQYSALPLVRCRVVGVDGDALRVALSDGGERRLLLRDDQRYLTRTAWAGATLHLLRPSGRDDALVAGFVILHPDYLIDVSRVASCFKEWGAHPLHYLYQLFEPRRATAYTLLGNTVNQFFDDNLLGGCGYNESVQEAFHADALDYLVTDGLRQIYFPALRSHYDHLRETTIPPASSPSGVRRGEVSDGACLLEPTLLCPALGLQGRMDYLSLTPPDGDSLPDGEQREATVVELKSGRWDDFAHGPRRAHRVQVELYAAALRYSLGIPATNIHGYLLYSRYPHLVSCPTGGQLATEALRLRNGIVAILHEVATDGGRRFFTPAAVEAVSSSQGKLWLQYGRPKMLALVQAVDKATAAMQEWFFAQLRLLMAEEEAARTGEGASGDECGASALWRRDAEAKVPDGEIIAPLRLENLDIGTRGCTGFRFRITEPQDVAPDFRTGDSVLLYFRDAPDANAATRLVYRGGITEIAADTLVVRLRQPLSVVLAARMTGRTFACEHDDMGGSLAASCRALRTVLEAKAVAARADRADSPNLSSPSEDSEASAFPFRPEDFSLLVGPPGTGKTSVALRNIVDRLFHERGENLLLVAYTHRALDEICRALSSIPDVDYLRMGNELHCPPEFRDRLLRRAIDGCASRAALAEIVTPCRVFVGTAASLQLCPALFALKHFHTVIADEATQLLEHQVIDLLVRADRFILIGDPKQLPAVTLRTGQVSLFERLYRDALRHCPTAVSMLDCQGRMHPAIAALANHLFYENRLRPVPLPHQQEAVPWVATPRPAAKQQPRPASPREDTASRDSSISLVSSRSKERQSAASEVAFEVASSRLAFLHVAPPAVVGRKCHPGEAEVVARLAVTLLARVRRYGHEVSASTLGIIVPYRSQVAAVRRALAVAMPADAALVDVDTVERYQGSQRDIIIFGATVSTEAQLGLLSTCVDVGGVTVDRKLNVIITRARRQFFMVGNRDLLMHRPLYARLIHEIEGAS